MVSLAISMKLRVVSVAVVDMEEFCITMHWDNGHWQTGSAISIDISGLRPSKVDYVLNLLDGHRDRAEGFKQDLIQRFWHVTDRLAQHFGV
jgi:hypothetical protein